MGEQQQQKQQSKALTPVQLANQQVAEIKRRLDTKRDEIGLMLRDNHQAQRLMMSALMHASDSPKIRECEPNSIVRAVVQAALCGADISAGLGEGYLVPYRNKDLNINECQFMPGYRLGQRKIHEATGLRIVADVVCENDHWRYSQVPLILEHTPAEENRGKMLRSYAVALDKDGKVQFAQIATAKDIENAKIASRKGRDKDSPAWRQWEDRMWRKVAIMRLAKEVRAFNPNPQLDRILEAEEVAHNGARALIGDLPPPRIMAPAEPTEGRHQFGRKRQAAPAPEPEPQPQQQAAQEEPPPPTEEPPADDNGQRSIGF